MDRFPLAVIGAGPAGANYIDTLRQDWRLQIVGFTNRSPERRRRVAQSSGLPGYADLKTLLAEAPVRPRLVVIATANPTHKDFAIEAMEHGCDVFCEKPMAMNLDDCRAMLAVERRTGRQLQVGFEYRYGSMTARLKKLLDAGDFGSLTNLDISDSRGHWWPDDPDAPEEQVWRLNPAIGGGPLLHCGIHQIDLLRYYAGEVAEVQAFVARKSLCFYPDGIPDHLNLQFRFVGGATGSFTLYHNIAGTWYRPIPRHHPDYHSVPGHHMDLILTGSAGSAICELYREELHLNAFDHDNRETRYLRTESFGHQHGNVSHHNTPQMIIDTALRLRDGQSVLHSADDSYRTTQLGLICEELVQEAIADGWSSQRLRLA